MIIGSDFLCVGFFLLLVLLKVLMSLSEHVHIKITVKKKKQKTVRSSTVCVQKEWNNVGALC